MSDYCKQCSLAMFGRDFYDLAYLSTPADTRAGQFPVVLCESCGPIQVDHTGFCICIDCYEGHGPCLVELPLTTTLFTKLLRFVHSTWEDWTFVLRRAARRWHVRATICGFFETVKSLASWRRRTKPNTQLLASLFDSPKDKNH